MTLASCDDLKFEWVEGIKADFAVEVQRDDARCE